MEGVDLVLQIDKTSLHLLAEHVRGHMEGLDMFAQITQLGSAHPVPISSLGPLAFIHSCIFKVVFRVCVSFSNYHSGMFFCSFFFL